MGTLQVQGFKWMVLKGGIASADENAQKKKKNPPDERRVARPSMRGNSALALAYELEPYQEPELIDNVIPIGQRRTLLELNEDTCRWPIGDPATPEFFFCGGKPLTGLPYCGYHSRVAYQPANERRRDRRPQGPPFRQG